ncbi:unnamed protein product [Durusdinium trenchii]|uniref:Fucolectin tachylectin-4 pentraxin-1 domain-containing protein n=1 Tax=Durusdinium trenchii TaxID=1381693 RepID=A0ABP0QWM4_9DINO
MHFLRWTCLLLQIIDVQGLALDYLEIGTADFDTLAQQLHGTEGVAGLSVEPVEEHFQRLPERPPLLQKLRAAVAEADGEAELYVVRQEYMEPQCSNETVRELGLPYCLPWWFRATASLHRPAALVSVHAGPKALEAQVAMRVPTVSYASLMRRYGVTRLHLLKIDTEGFDVFILKQMLAWGEMTGQYPERLQFERNNLTDVQESQQILEALQAAYDCWIPAAEDDVQCLRLGDLAVGQPYASSGVSFPTPWWRLQLPDRLQVAGVRISLEDKDSLVVKVGDSLGIHLNRLCGPVQSTETGAVVARCALEGRYVMLLGTSQPRQVEVLGPRTAFGAFRLSLGQRCCHRGCNSSDTSLFEGYDPQCERRCREDHSCHFFTSFNSLWCITYADCEEELPERDAASVTFGLWPRELLPLPILRSSAQQSSVDWGGEAHRAIDGIFDPHFLRGSCSHTAQESQNSWWAARVDPETATAVTAVRVLGRWDCCHERLDGWEVRVGFDPDVLRNPRCGTVQSPLAAGGRRTIHCGQAMVGDMVGVVLPSGEPLTLCEVEVFGPYRW